MKCVPATVNGLIAARRIAGRWPGAAEAAEVNVARLRKRTANRTRIG
jgi:hypothetical protein